MCNFANLCPGCGVCRNVCPFLAEYGTPDRILKDRPEVSFFCTSCRRCDGVCTKALSPSAAFFEVKRRLVRQNAIPPPVVKALDSARRFAKTGHGFPFSFYEPADIVFWPGCGLAAHRPGLVHRVRNILSRQLKKQVGLALDCCYDPVYGLGDTGTALAALNRIGERLRKRSVRQVITGCLNCHKLLSEHLEGIHVVFILEMLPSEVFSKQQRESVYLHHPCPSSRWEAIQDKAKEAIASLGVDFTDRGADLKSVPPGPTVSESSAALCCGNGGGLSALDPNLADRFLDRITKEAADRTMVTYCTGCQDRFLKRGRAAVHLLECLPGVKPRRTNSLSPCAVGQPFLPGPGGEGSKGEIPGGDHYRVLRRRRLLPKSKAALFRRSLAGSA